MKIRKYHLYFLNLEKLLFLLLDAQPFPHCHDQRPFSAFILAPPHLLTHLCPFGHWLQDLSLSFQLWDIILFSVPCLPSDCYLLFWKDIFVPAPNFFCWEEFKSSILILSLPLMNLITYPLMVVDIPTQIGLEKHGFSTLLNFSFPWKTSAHYCLTLGFCPSDSSLLITFLLLSSLQWPCQAPPCPSPTIPPSWMAGP